MSLFKPVWQSDNLEKARKVFLKKLTDETLLLIAMETKHDEIRQEAVSRISSTDNIVKATLGEDWAVAKVAVSELGKRDQKTLFDIGISITKIDFLNKNSKTNLLFRKYGALREIISKNITDQKLLGQFCRACAEYAGSHGTEFAFLNAIMRLTDQEGMALSAARYNCAPQLNLKDDKGYLLPRLEKHITDTLTDEKYILACMVNIFKINWFSTPEILKEKRIYSVLLSNIHTPDTLHSIIGLEKNKVNKDKWKCDEFIKAVNNRLNELSN